MRNCSLFFLNYLKLLIQSVVAHVVLIKVVRFLSMKICKSISSWSTLAHPFSKLANKLSPVICGFSSLGQAAPPDHEANECERFLVWSLDVIGLPVPWLQGDIFAGGVYVRHINARIQYHGSNLVLAGWDRIFTVHSEIVPLGHFAGVLLDHKAFSQCGSFFENDMASDSHICHFLGCLLNPRNVFHQKNITYAIFEAQLSYRTSHKMNSTRSWNHSLRNEL